MSRGADDRYKYSALEPPITLSSDRAEIVNPVDQLRQGISAFEQKDELTGTSLVGQPSESIAADAESTETSPNPVEQEFQTEEHDEQFHSQGITEESPVEGPVQITAEHTPEVLPSTAEATRQDFGESHRSDLRSDIVAHGFTDFHQEFDPSKILCIYTNGDEDSVALAFFHAEGMAFLVGVGLPFCTVKLKADSTVEIRATEEELWKSYWTEEGRKEFSHSMLFDSRTTVPGPPTAALTPQPSYLSTEESAELFGVGVEDIDAEDEDLEFHSISDDDAIPPAWIGQLREFMAISVKGQKDPIIRAEIFKPVKGETGRVIGTVVSALNDDMNASSSNIYHSATDTSCSDISSGYWLQHNPLYEGSNTPAHVEVDDDGVNDISEEPQHHLQLTVKIFLDPVRYTLYSHKHGQDVRFRRPAAASKELEVFYPSGGGLELLRMSDNQMVPKVTIKFVYEGVGNSNTRCRKRLITTLKTNFHMDASVDREDYFGWYHDGLRLSLECLTENSVRRNTKDFRKEVLTEHRISTTRRRRGEETGNVRGSSQQRGVKLSGGGGLFGVNCLQLSASCKRVRRLEETSTTHDVEYNEFEITCLKGSSFSISKAELDDQQLAYRASLYPPISYINIWDEGQRQQAQSNGIMSTIQLKIRGHWTVKPQDDRSLPVTLADYDFLCRRDLIRYERVRTAAAKRSTLGCFGSTSGEVELVEEKIVLRQELPKRFLINHSFSHMDFRLFQQADVYKWDLRTQDYSPVMPLLR